MFVNGPLCFSHTKYMRSDVGLVTPVQLTIRVGALI